MGKISDALEKSRRTEIQEVASSAAKPDKPVDLNSRQVGHPKDDRSHLEEDTIRARKSEVETDSPPTIDKPKILPAAAPQTGHELSSLEGIADKLVAVKAPHSFEAEQFRLLRTNIMFPANGTKTPRSILISSMQPGDGKSFVASNLAATIAQNIDRHVLLVDCDLRKPTIHKLFGLSDQVPGLSDYLLSGTPIPQLLLHTNTPRLSILPGGPIPPNPSELLSSNRMASLMKEVLSRYEDRYIIVDSPPPQIAAESAALAQYVEGIILVIKMGQTDRDAAMQIVEKMGKEKVLGVVANWLTQRSVGYYGSGKYDQYAYYRKSK